MPAASFLLASIGLLPRRFLLQPASLPDPKSQGHPLSGPFVEGHQGVHPHVCPRSGFLAASRRGCARQRLGFAPALWWQHLWFALALLRLRLRRRLVYALAFSREPSRLSRSATPCAQGTNASSLAAMAPSALPASPTPAVPSARAGAAPATGNAPPRSCASTLEGSSSPASAFSATPASPKGCGSMSSGNAGESPGTNGTPPCFLPVFCLQLQRLRGFGATAFGGRPLGGSALSQRILARWRRNRG